MKVHRCFGIGFPEAIYNRSLLIELEKAGLPRKSEIERDIYSEGRLIGRRRLDLIIDDNVLIELKAISELDRNC